MFLSPSFVMLGLGLLAAAGPIHRRSPAPLRIPLRSSSNGPESQPTRKPVAKRGDDITLLPLINNVYNTSWSGLVDFGTPPVTINIFIDTGSSDLWVPGDSCVDQCTGKSIFAPSQSSTSVPLPEPFFISYADASSAGGSVFTDVVSIAGITVTNLTFGVVSLLDGFDTEVSSGLMGLGYTGNSVTDSDNFIIAAYKQGAIPSPSFALKLTPTDSALFIGGVDETEIIGEVESHPVPEKFVGFDWVLGSVVIKIDGSVVASNLSTSIDSGTKFISANFRTFDAISRNIDGYELVLFDDGPRFTVPCDSNLTFAVNFGGADWEIPTGSLILPDPNLADPARCSLVFQAGNFPDNEMVLGDTFMSNVMSVFSFADNTISFAKLA